MPIYEYRCNKCGQFETMQKITDPTLRRCPTCQGKVTKLISSTSFQLKGSGWYATDYGRKGDGGNGEGKPKAAPKASETKTESAPTSEKKPTKSTESAAA